VSSSAASPRAAPPAVPEGWEAVIGLEIHVQLSTRSKMFCRCENVYGGEPNTRVCPVCTAHPGVLPVPNAAAVERAITVGLALGSRIAERSLFYRKNYFYPDSPKAYQISQYDEPLCLGGRLVVPTAAGDEVVGFVRAHLEEDAAKTVHEGGASGRIAGSVASIVDFNRCGTPLLEVVSEPDLRSPEAAVRFLTLLKQTIEELGVSDCDMEKGSLRADANVSLRRPGESALRPKVELKNMNSFRYLERGMTHELARQAAIYEAGGEVETHTVHYDPARDEMTIMRSKEDADDYRYFPEPDLVPVAPPHELIERLREALPELPGARLRRLEREHGLGFAEAQALARTPALSRYFELTASAAGDSRAAANWVLNELSAHLNEAGLAADETPVRPQALAGLIRLVADGTLGSAGAKQVFAALAAGEGEGDPARIVAERGLGQIADVDALRTVVREALAAHPEQAAQLRGGKQALSGFFVGQVMRATGGRAEPRTVQQLLAEELAAAAAGDA
jgi:aspartyl-tRNA(Asn)/glutamyl-tRNA(Gln) amidotransferase subunit B